MGVPHLRVGIVGCGKIAVAPGGAHLGDCRAALVAAVDPVGEAAEAFARRFVAARTYLDHRAMLAAERPDVVSVRTWPPEHVAPVVDAAAAGARGILCEKPMAVALPEADRMLVRPAFGRPSTTDASRGRIHAMRIPGSVEVRRHASVWRLNAIATYSSTTAGRTWKRSDWGSRW